MSLSSAQKSNRNNKIIFIAILFIFILAFSVRFFIWQDTKLEVRNFHTVLIETYQLKAKILLEDGFKVLFDSNHKFAALHLHFHPLGYSFLISGIYALFGESDTYLQFFSIAVDCFSVLILFLIVLELFPSRVAFLSAVLVSLAPNIAIYSPLLLPDTLAYFPILLAVLFFIKAYKQPKIWKIILSGFFIGTACWLRANIFLMPVFFIPFIFWLFPKNIRVSFILSFIAASILTVFPMTIRNLIVYGHFIPISLGAGQTLLQGIADYDKDNRFNIPKTDIGIANQEAEMLNRPDYAGALFGKDGIERDRNRVKRALHVIKENPVWFAGVMFRRALWMLQLEKARTISPEIPVTGSLEMIEDKPLIWTSTPESLSQKGKLLSTEGTVHLENDKEFVTITGDKSKKGEQFATEIIKVNPYRENVLKINLQLRQGRTRILVKDPDSSNLYALTEVNMLEGTSPENQPIKEIKIPFVSRSENVQIIFVNENPAVLPSVIVVRRLEIYEISDSSAYLLRPLRILLGSKNFYNRSISTVSNLRVLYFTKSRQKKRAVNDNDGSLIFSLHSINISYRI